MVAIKRKITLGILAFVAALMAVPLAACKSGSAGASGTDYQPATVQRGNLKLDITASGNLALAVKEDLAFEVSGTDADPVTVQEILVKAGDNIKKRDVLIKLDKSALDDQLTAAENAYKQAQISFKQQQNSARSQEISLESTRKSYEDAKLAVVRATPSAENSWVYYQDMGTVAANMGKAIGAVNEAIAGIDKEGQQVIADKGYLELLKGYLRLAQIAASKSVYVSVLPGQSYTAAVNAMEALINAETSARQALERAELSMENTRTSLELSQISLERAKDTYEDAKSRLEKSTLVAPFDGFVTNIPVSGGTNVKRGMIGISVADPNKFEVTVLVNEKDIYQIKIGGQATVQVDALSGLSLPATVTAVSPTATVQSGVVNYKVTIEVQQASAARSQSPTAGGTTQQNQGQSPAGQTPSGSQSGSQQPAAGAGGQRIIIQGQQGGQAGASQQAVQDAIRQRLQAAGQQSVQVPRVVENVQLKEGLTVTVNILIDQKTNILLVPNGAVAKRSGQSYVKVIQSDGTLEERLVQTGMTNYQSTEITSGLKDGEIVAVPKGASTSGSTNRQQQSMGIPGGGMMLIK